ncbi:hypothetical protein EOI86_10165 [Hwanghaeella grinnelliae]|uniref:DUF1468 domain-containing protein n=1 Tax=Hwanghaeella grinnelliae TaxID=2500179 RepID=A0A437QYI9_9PROT|nr:tripartite tricarboxylate transporter TctB family protein [Hwanghaeella grinnelliae]RVU39566.1 hypothetical protein EOI86_10165 [Hwanghaeella grinnelliae]
MRRANVISGVILVIFGLVMLAVVIPMQINPGPDGMMSPRLVPGMMMGVVIALSLLLVINNIRAKATADDSVAPISRGEIRALVTIGVIFGAAILLYLLVSPLAAGAVIVIGALLALGERRPLVLIAMPTGLLTAIWFLFYKVLGTGIV